MTQFSTKDYVYEIKVINQISGARLPATDSNRSGSGLQIGCRCCHMESMPVGNTMEPLRFGLSGIIWTSLTPIREAPASTVFI